MVTTIIILTVSLFLTYVGKKLLQLRENSIAIIYIEMLILSMLCGSLHRQTYVVPLAISEILAVTVKCVAYC